MLCYPYYDKNMRKKSPTNKFLESCYFKFRLHRSLSATKSNPLLVPNTWKQDSLCPASTKKRNSLYHHKTMVDWTTKQAPDFDIRKNAQEKKNKNQEKNMLGTIIVSKLQNSFPSNKLNNHLKLLKKERNNIFKQKSSNIQVEKIQNMTFHNETIKNLLSGNEIFLSSQEEYPDRSNKQSRKQRRRVLSIERRNYWRSYPNKHNSSQQFLKNDSSLTFRGWDYSPQNQQISNMHSSKHAYKF